jgi:hypothetical protein
MKYIALALLLTVLFGSKLSAKIIVDFSNLDVTDIVSIISRDESRIADAVIISHPFKKPGGERDRGLLVYDYWDTGEKWQRGVDRTIFGRLSDFKRLVDNLRAKNIEVYCLVDIFNHSEDFNLEFWHQTDFLSRRYSLPGFRLLNIENPNTRRRLDTVFTGLREINVDKWVFDLRNIPGNLEKSYAEYVRRGFRNGKLILLNNPYDRREDVVSSQAFWQLRSTNFLMPVADFSSIDRLAIPEYIHWIESGQMSVNNIATMIYILANNRDIVIPAEFLKYGNVVRMLDAVKDASQLKNYVYDETKMFLYSTRFAIGFNFSEEISVFKTPRLILSNGRYNSVTGSGVLTVGSDNNYFFMLPSSVYVWKIN